MSTVPPSGMRRGSGDYEWILVLDPIAIGKEFDGYYSSFYALDMRNFADLVAKASYIDELRVRLARWLDTVVELEVQEL